LINAKLPVGKQQNNSKLLLTSFLGESIQEHALHRAWIERRSVELPRKADTPLRFLVGVLCAYGKPTASVYEQRGVVAALALRVLTKPNRGRAAHNRKSRPSK